MLERIKVHLENVRIVLSKAAIVFILAVLFCRIGYAAEPDFYNETVLRTLKLEFSQSNWWSLLESKYESKENILASLIVDDVAYEGVGVRFRGNTSYMMNQNSQKKSFNIEIDYTTEEQHMMGYKTLNLINCFGDATFMREVLYSNICHRQIPSARANFIKLEINGENWGIYANVQQLNAEFIEDWFPSNDGTRWRAEGNMGGPGDGGPVPPARTTADVNPDIVQEWPGGGGGFGDGSAALTWQGSDSSAYEQVYELKNTNQDDPWASLINTCHVLNNTPLEQLPDELDRVLNVDRALWLCAFEIVFQDDDGYVNKRGSDYCIYYEPESGRLNLMQYDGNESFGQNQWSLFYQSDDPLVPLMYRLMAIDSYEQRYLAHVRTMLDVFYNEDVLIPKIDEYRNLIEDEVEADTKKLYSYRQFELGIDDLKNIIKNRHNFLLGNRALNRSAPEIISVNQEVLQGDAEQSLVITAYLGDTVPVLDVQLYLAEGLLEPFISLPMADDGCHGDGAAGDGVYGCILENLPVGTVIRYYVQAKADDGAGTVSFEPECAEYDVYTHIVTYAQAHSSSVVINELMAKNNSTIADPQGNYDDWIELFNLGEETLDLSGMYLSDNPENPLKWRFPAGATIAAGEYLVVWADEDGGDEPGLHTNFKLSSKGETVWLFDTDAHDNLLLDTISFTGLEGDQSIGRVPDGIGQFQILPVPSPLASNAG